MLKIVLSRARLVAGVLGSYLFVISLHASMPHPSRTLVTILKASPESFVTMMLYSMALNLLMSLSSDWSKLPYFRSRSSVSNFSSRSRAAFSHFMARSSWFTSQASSLSFHSRNPSSLDESQVGGPPIDFWSILFVFVFRAAIACTTD